MRFYCFEGAPTFLRKLVGSPNDIIIKDLVIEILRDINLTIMTQVLSIVRSCLIDTYYFRLIDRLMLFKICIIQSRESGFRK